MEKPKVKKKEESKYYDDTVNKRIRKYIDDIYNEDKKTNNEGEKTKTEIKKDLAEKWKMTPSKLNRIISGYATPNREQLNYIARTFNCYVDELVGNLSKDEKDVYKRLGLYDETVQILKCNIPSNLFKDNLKYNDLYSIILNSIICENLFLQEFRSETQKVLEDLIPVATSEEHRSKSYEELCQLSANDKSNLVENMNINMHKAVDRLIKSYMEARIDYFRKPKI